MIEKNVRKVRAKAQRVWFDMNTGTREHASKKHPSRNQNKKDLRKTLDKLGY